MASPTKMTIRFNARKVVKLLKEQGYEADLEADDGNVIVFLSKDGQPIDVADILHLVRGATVTYEPYAD